MTENLTRRIQVSREGAIRMAESYLQGGLVAHDPDQPQLAPSCFRHENGWETGDREVILKHFPAMTMCVGVRSEHWLVELPLVFVRYELLLDEAHGGSKPIAEFFTVGENGIEEVAAVFPLRRWMDNTRGPGSPEIRGERPAPRREPQQQANVDCCRQVVRALTSSSGADLPFAEDVSLTENGALAARGRARTTERLRHGIFSGVVAAREQQWVVEGEEVVGRLELERNDGELEECAAYLRLYRGRVCEIDLTWGPGPGPALAAAWRESTRGPLPTQ